jgi:hypothetical protein
MVDVNGGVWLLGVHVASWEDSYGRLRQRILNVEHLDQLEKQLR